MCGLTGLYSFEARINRQELHGVALAMNNALLHRGPDSGDIWQDPDVPFALGHRRLAIIDLTPSGAQPMESPSGRYMVAFNGEIYNFQDLRKEIEQNHNHKFKGHSDTEIMLAGFEYWGVEDTLEKLNGMFAIALWDRKTRALFLARDRFGKKPLYVGWAGSTLVFGSETKALAAHPNFRRDVNRDALTSYMRFGYVPAPFCMYDQVWQLPAGHMMAIDTHLLRGGQDLKPLMSSYWSHKQAMEDARANPIDNLETIVDDFEELLSNCVTDRMISDVPLGAFLSGGIDSSSVVAMMQKHSSKPVKTYTIGFNEDGFNEAEYAKKIAQHLGTDHHELYLDPKKALEIVPKMATMYDEPFADVSALPTFLVSEFAREDVTVALSGDGGDEMLGGYARHVTGPKAWNAVNNIPAPLRDPFSKMIKSISPAMWSALRGGKPQFGTHVHKFAEILPKEIEGDVYLSFVTHWQNPKSMVMDGQERIIPLVDPEQQIEGLSFAENMMYWDALTYLNGDILTKVDRASMAVSLEARAPLLDRRIYDYAWRLPLESKIKNGKGKWLLREVLKKHVPEELIERPKQGFCVPIGDWLRGDLKDWAEDLLDENILRDQGFFNYPEILKAWSEHQKGRGNHAMKLWTVLCFQDWYRQWVVL